MKQYYPQTDQNINKFPNGNSSEFQIRMILVSVFLQDFLPVYNFKTRYK